MIDASPAYVIMHALVDAGLADRAISENEWTVVIGHIPATPGNVLVVMDTTAISDGRLMSTGEQIEHPGIQIICRHAQYNPGFRKLSQIALAVDQWKRLVVAVEDKQFMIHNFSRKGSIIPVGQEAGSTKQLFSLNATVTISEITNV